MELRVGFQSLLSIGSRHGRGGRHICRSVPEDGEAFLGFVVRR